MSSTPSASLARLIVQGARASKHHLGIPRVCRGEVLEVILPSKGIVVEEGDDVARNESESRVSRARHVPTTAGISQIPDPVVASGYGFALVSLGCVYDDYLLSWAGLLAQVIEADSELHRSAVGNDDY